MDSYQSFQVGAQIVTPIIITDGYLTLDAIVEHQIAARGLDIESPIEKFDGIPLASAALIYGGMPNQSASFVKSVSGADVEEGLLPLMADSTESVSIKTNSGKHKSILSVYDRRIELHDGQPIQIIWLVRARQSALMNILRDVQGIGKKFGSGYGQIDPTSWQTDPLDGDDPSAVLRYENDALRPIPMTTWQKLCPVPPQNAMPERFRFPYHLGDMTLCAVPTRTIYMTEGDWR